MGSVPRWYTFRSHYWYIIPCSSTSTPYSRSGLLWEQYKAHYGQAQGSAALIWRAPTRIMNPTIDATIINDALRNDFAAAKAEWEAEWREDIEAFLGVEMIEAAMVPGRFELPKIKDAQYFGFIDPSGGRQDSFALATCHEEENGKIVLDCLREARPPFQPQNVVSEFADILKDYDISYVESDRYAGEWVSSAFAEQGITVENTSLSSSDIYLEFLPLLMNGSVELLDNRRLFDQLRGLERKTRTGGKDLISHGPFLGAHDDLAIAVAGAVVRASRHEGSFSPEFLAHIMFPEPKLSRQERFDKYIKNWLHNIPQKSWKPEDDMDD